MKKIGLSVLLVVFFATLTGMGCTKGTCNIPYESCEGPIFRFDAWFGPGWYWGSYFCTEDAFLCYLRENPLFGD